MQSIVMGGEPDINAHNNYVHAYYHNHIRTDYDYE